MLQPRIRPLAAGIRSLLANKCSTGSTSTLWPRGYASVAKLRQDTGKVTEPEQTTAEDDEPTVTLRTYKPRTPGIRHLRRPINDHLWKGRPYRPLTFPKKGQSRGGRNNTGRITVRHRGGGHKRRIRTVDFYRQAPGAHIVERIEHDPGRSAHIALIQNKKTKERTYIIAADGMRAGDIIYSYRAGIPKELLDAMGGVVDPGILAARTAHRGNCLPLHMIPVGTVVYCIASSKAGGAKFCRSAGTYGTVMAREEETLDDGTKRVVGKHVQVRLQSGEIRKVDKEAVATIGIASNVHFNYRQLGKAGRSRWLGRRPHVRGVAMNSGMHTVFGSSSLDPVQKLTRSVQLIILMVVVVESPRVTEYPSVPGAHRYVSFKSFGLFIIRQC